LDILEQVGVQFSLPEALKLFDDAGAEVDHKEKTVKIPYYLVEECVRKTPHRFTAHGRDPRYTFEVEPNNLHFGTVGFATRIVDPETEKFRPLLKTDLANLARLADALENVDYFLTMGEPMDAPMGVADRYQWLLSLENIGKHIWCQSLDREGAIDAIKMGSLICGGEKELAKAPIFTVVVCLPSPLKHDPGGTEALMEAARVGVPMMVDSGPLSGANSPATLAGTLVLNVAELLSSVVLTRLVNPRSPMVLTTWARSLDMKTGNVVVGSPEFGLLHGCIAQMGRFYDIPTGGGGVLSDSKILDAQNGYEKMLTGILPALSGLNMVTGMGLTGSETIACFQQLVIDNEIVGMIKRAKRGVDFSREALAVDLIKKVRFEGNFLKERHTLDHFQTEHWIPSLSDRDTPDGWVRNSSPDLRKKAKETAMQILKTHQPVLIPREISAELRKVVDSAERKHAERSITQ
jgi:trimethylamine--corrinoid protein Co-methyltransferase